MKSRELMQVVLPRLARPLYRQLKRYRAGQLDDSEFTQGFETLLRRQHAWLAERGVPESHAALAIHGAVLILSSPGLRAEAEQAKLPLELIEFQAVREAARDIASNYDIDFGRATRVIASLVARYGE